MTTRELTEGIEDIIVHQCLEETQPSQIQIPGYADWNPWDSAAKTMFLAELERRGRIHRVEHPGQRTTQRSKLGKDVELYASENVIRAEEIETELTCCARRQNIGSTNARLSDIFPAQLDSKGCIVKTNQLLPGDVFIQYSNFNPYHSLMYVGPAGVERSVCHAVSGSGKSGVIMGSLKSYSENGELDAEMSVYRCIRPEGLAAKAAEYAKRWTEKSVEGADWEAIKKIQAGEAPYEFKTKFSNKKKNKAEMDKSDVEMTAKGVMKIAKAYVSAADAGRVYALHPRNGVCCSQFIHYSFQAASIDLAVGGGSLKVPDAFIDDGVIRNTFRIKNFTPLFDGGPGIFEIWNEFTKAAPSKIIEPLRFDTSRTHVGRLWDILNSDAKSEEPHFALVQGVGPHGKW